MPDVPKPRSNSVGSVPTDEEVCEFAVTGVPGSRIPLPSDIKSVCPFILWVRTDYEPIAYSS